VATASENGTLGQAENRDNGKQKGKTPLARETNKMAFRVTAKGACGVPPASPPRAQRHFILPPKKSYRASFSPQPGRLALLFLSPPG